jgi:uncharacterized damage-inducible protein DinB
MADFSVVQSSLSDYYRMIQAEVHELTEPLSSEQIWTRPYPYGNSIGNLILHLTGNFNYYIGAQIGGTGYVRQRPLEFSSSGKPKDELLGDFDRAVEIVIATIAKQSDDDWAAPYFGELESEAKTRFNAVLRCAGHAYHHVGQMIYLQREMRKAALGS